MSLWRIWMKVSELLNAAFEEKTRNGLLIFGNENVNLKFHIFSPYVIKIIIFNSKKISLLVLSIGTHYKLFIKSYLYKIDTDINKSLEIIYSYMFIWVWM